MEQSEHNKTAKQKAFVSKLTRRSLQLRNEITISANGNSIQGEALWDTGASCSCISYTVAAKLNLPVIGKRRIQTPSGGKTVNRYIITVHLPGGVIVDSLEVCEADIEPQRLSLLIGMDIITTGDFAVSNFGGATTFSFRIPSQSIIDFVAQMQETKISQTGK